MPISTIYATIHSKRRHALGFAGLLRAEESAIPETPERQIAAKVADATYGTLTEDTTLIFSDAGALTSIAAEGKTIALKGAADSQDGHYLLNTVTADKVKLLQGRWAQEEVNLSGIGELWVADGGKAGQFWAKNANLPQAFFLGKSAYTEGNAYGGAAMRVDFDASLQQVTILPEGSKITQGSNFTVAQLAGSGDLAAVDYGGPYTLTLTDAAAYSGTLTRTAGALTLGSDMPNGGLNLSNATLALGNAQRTVKSATLSNATFTVDALPTGGATLGR